MNWEDILKVQITTSRQKLRTDKEPLPDDDEDECFPIVDKIFREILKHVVTFQGNTYANKRNTTVGTLEAFSRNLYDEDEWCKILAGFSDYEHHTLTIIDRKPEVLYINSRFDTKGYFNDGLKMVFRLYLDRERDTPDEDKLDIDINIFTSLDIDTKYHVMLRFSMPDLTIGVMEELEFMHEAIKNTIESNAKVSFPTDPTFMNKVREYTRGI